MSIRVRFAPSPTGHLHIGGARTALFNWLLARQKSGSMILRIEDTDMERSSQEMVEGIVDGLTWLGLHWDEGPFFQSARRRQHLAVVDRLLQEGKAYRDFTKEGSSEDYRSFRDLAPVEREERLDGKKSFAVRFRVPEGKRIEFHDQVYGRVEVETDTLEDFVILRSDGKPTYHLSVVVDDLEMGITHIIRGADHLSNTGKHILLYQALEEPVPNYAHLLLILGPEQWRLSNRHGATSVLEYRRQRILPSALLKYLALLGWSPGTDREVFSVQELIDKFSLDRVNKTNAVFDSHKIQWMNGQHISRMSAEELEPFVREVLEEAGIWNPDWEAAGRQHFLSTIELIKSRVYLLTDFATFGRAYFTEDFEYTEAARKRYLEPSEEERSPLVEGLQELRDAYRTLEPFDLGSTEECLRAIAERKGIKPGLFIGAVRVATTGQVKAPGIFDVLVTLGREQTVTRLDRVIRFLQQ